MGLTLIEAAKYEHRLEHLAVLKTFSEGELLARLPFMNIAGSGLFYSAEQELPSVGFRAVNEGYTQSYGVVDQRAEAVHLFGGDVDVDRSIIERTEAIPGAYLSGEAATLRKDLEKLLTPYGFRHRNDNVRHGYAIGTALLSAHRLREIHGVVSQAAGRLADPTAQDLLRELEQRLAWGGIAVDGTTPVRAFANRSIVSSALVRPDSLAAERQAEALETAIVERRRIELERYVSVGSFADSPNGSFRVWPLQLLFHNIGWYLVFEDDAIGTGVGLIRSERIDRLALRRSERGNRRSDEAHSQALRRLELLLHHSGGIYFGSDLKSQLRLASPNARIRAKQLVTLRFCCQGWCFAFIREGLQRYPIEHTRFSRPLAGEHWWHHPNAPHVLEPGSSSDTHPYPVELDLPPWTVERDIDGLPPTGNLHGVQTPFTADRTKLSAAQFCGPHLGSQLVGSAPLLWLLARQGHPPHCSCH